VNTVFGKKGSCIDFMQKLQLPLHNAALLFELLFRWFLMQFPMRF